jgi:protein phosphatase
MEIFEELLPQVHQTKPSDPEATILIDHTKPTVETACASHIGTRQYQQDAVLLGTGRGDIVFGILCDGMGGLEDGELASRTAVESVSEALRGMDPECNIPSFLISTAILANGAVGAIPSASGRRGESGTTLTVAVITKGSLFWASVGDSRIYILRHGEIVSVTRDHSYSLELGEMVAKGKITAEDAANDPGRDALISYLGIDNLELIDFNHNAFALEHGDIVLLCSDGLYRSLSDADIAGLVARHGDELDECARVLPLYAFDNAKGAHQDNTSVVLLRYQNGADTTV